MKGDRRGKRLLLACLCASLCFHGLMLYLFQVHSVWFSNPASAPKRLVTWEMTDRGSILKQVFQDLAYPTKGAPLTPQKIDSSEKLRQSLAFLDVDAPEPALQTFLPAFSFHPSNLLSYNHSTPSCPSLPPATLHPISLEAAFEVLKAPQANTKKPSLSPAEEPEEIFLSITPPSSNQPEIKTGIAYEEEKLIQAPPLCESGVKKKGSFALPPPPLPSFPTLGELDTYSYSDSFDLDIVCSPRDDGQEGFFFAATLIPHPDLSLPKIRQHYAFLIDKANSIQRERLLATKNAVLRALNELDPEDTFNIIVFDSKVEKVFAQNVQPDSASLAKAKAFLDKIQLGSFFAPADLYNPLFLTLPHPVKEDEIYTSILMTDGDGLSKKTSLRSLLHTWTLQNSGKTCLYTLGMGGDSNLSVLDAASAMNRGRLYSSPTKRGLKRKLLKMMKNIHVPIAKNLTPRAISTSGAVIDLFPKSTHIQHLYLDQPIVILGSSKTLDDFILFVQGRGRDSWFNIKKRVSFVNAKKGGPSLRKEWAVQQAYRCYENYIRDDNPEHLAEARRLLSPFDIQPAFE